MEGLSIIQARGVAQESALATVKRKGTFRRSLPSFSWRNGARMAVPLFSKAPIRQLFGIRRRSLIATMSAGEIVSGKENRHRVIIEGELVVCLSRR